MSKEFLLQYAGGTSTPHGEQNKNTRDWGEFFEAQSLVEKELGNGNNRMVVFKTSSISPNGVMVIDTAPADREPIRNWSYMSQTRTQDHLGQVGKVMASVRELEPNADLYLWQVNASDEKPFPYPTYFAHPQTGIPTRNSQTVGTLHSHVDAISVGEAIRVNSLSKLITAHRAHIQGDPNVEQNLQRFVAEKRLQETPRMFHRLAKEIWESEMVPYLLGTYPELFDSIIDPEKQSSFPLPDFGIKLKDGFESFGTKQFAQVIQDIHRMLISNWAEVANLINTGEIDNFASDHAWASKYQEGLKSLRRVVVQDRKKVIPQKWMHKKYNYTVGVAQWKGQDAILFVNPTPEVNAGIEAVHFHSVRETRELTDEEITSKDAFRASLTKNLLSQDSSLKPGQEGRYLLDATNS